MPRRAKLKPQDFERRWFTIGCPGWLQIQLDSPSRNNHIEECRGKNGGGIDISSRRAKPKRRFDDDDMEGDSQDKKPRPRSPTVSYRTDAESVGSNMDDRNLDMLDDIDKKVLSAAIMGVDITEIHSPERVDKAAKKFGIVSGSSMDLANGWDFDREDHKRLAWKRVREEAPYL